MKKETAARTLTVLFDADDVVEDLTDCWVELLNERYGTHVTIEEIRDWDVSLAFPTLTKEQVYSVVKEDEVWGRMTPISGSQRVLSRLYEEGHQLYMVTASDYRSCKAKMDVILAMFPFLDWDHVILTSRKQMVRGDVLIDDGPHNLVGGDYVKLLFDRPYNRSFREQDEGMIRVRTWDEIEEILQEMARKDG